MPRACAWKRFERAASSRLLRPPTWPWIRPTSRRTIISRMPWTRRCARWTSTAKGKVVSMTQRCLLMLVVVIAAAVCRAGDPSSPGSTDAPKIFLDKSPRVVAYQLKRLTNPQLIALDRRDDDPRYRPIYEALLTRQGLERKYRDEAIGALSKLDKSDP